MKNQKIRSGYSLGLIFLLVLLIGACSKPWDWVPEQTQSLDYIKLEEHPGPFCFNVCSYFTVYLFENGDLVYYGGPGNVKRGWAKKKLEPMVYTRAFSLLEKYHFLRFRDEYRDGEVGCGNEYLTDQGEIWFSLIAKPLRKRVIYDYGCSVASDRNRVMKLWVEMKKLLPLDDWVGREHYTWDFGVLLK